MWTFMQGIFHLVKRSLFVVSLRSCQLNILTDNGVRYFRLDNFIAWLQTHFMTLSNLFPLFLFQSPTFLAGLWTLGVLFSFNAGGSASSTTESGLWLEPWKVSSFCLARMLKHPAVLPSLPLEDLTYFRMMAGVNSGSESLVSTWVRLSEET